MAESKNLSLQHEATSETISEADKQSQHEYGKTTCCSLANAMISQRTEFLAGTLPFERQKRMPFCERLIGSLRRECLDWLIPLGERHLRVLPREWAAHYNRGTAAHEPWSGHSRSSAGRSYTPENARTQSSERCGH
jgi:hypothetical protein